MNTTNAETKTNRYTILDAEIKRVSNALKQKKQEMIKAIKEAENTYRKYRTEVYTPARKAAFDVFKASKVLTKVNGVKKEVKKEVKKDVAKKKPTKKPTKSIASNSTVSENKSTEVK